MQLDAENRTQTSAFVDTSGGHAPYANADQRSVLETPRLGGDQNPIEFRESVVGEVQLNLGRCREEKILFPGSAEVETHNEFRAVKRRLLLAMSGVNVNTGYPNTVLITSAMPREGKTFTALNLALTLAAERDIHVLLMEGDVVNPSLHDYFTSAKVRKGLTDVLNGTVPAACEVVHPCAGVANLSVMFAGTPDPRAPELMASARMPEVLAQLSASYRDLFVVIDCSPVISPEPAALCAHVHHSIMVVAAEQTSRLQLQEALNHVSASPQVSLLFNKSPRWRKHGAYYGYGYGTTADAPRDAENPAVEVG
jgi:receptor protein-tyrosine kinase